MSKNAKKTRVLFVCTGNTCRSPMLEKIFLVYLKKERLLSKFDIKSAGIYTNKDDKKINDNALNALIKLGINVKEHIPKQLTKRMIEKKDIIICLEEYHKSIIGKDKHSIISLKDIDGLKDALDPYGKDFACYLNLAEYFIFCCPYILKYIKTFF